MQLRKTFQKVSDLYHNKLELNQRLYVNALVILPFALCSLALPFGDATRGLFAIVIFYWISAIGVDLLGVFVRVYASTLGKAILLVTFSLCTNIAIALASQFVNSVVGLDPSKFPRAIALLSILSIPIFAIGAVAILYLVLLASSGFLLIFHSLPDDRLKATVFPWHAPREAKPFIKSTRLVQLLSIAVFSGMVFGFAGKLFSPYEQFLYETARSFVYHWEMYSQAPCQLPPNTRAAFIADDRILLGRKDGDTYKFFTSECKPIAN